MAEEFRKELVSKDGRTVVATSPREYNDLVYGAGYTEKGADSGAKAKPANGNKTAKTEASS